MKKQGGFTLIEVLVAVVVLAGGLLGLAGLQARGLSNNQSAYNRSQATQFAYDIADRMRANSVAKANYITSNATLVAVAACDTTPCGCTSSLTSCSGNEFAVKDLHDWFLDLRALPSGTGTITVVGGIYTITVSWDDSKSGAANTSFVMNIRL
jgi:type IV pilus assembly protein PilV